MSPNSRGLKLQLLEQYQQSGPTAVLILGSSRSMKLSPQLIEQLTGDRAFNASVFSGGPNDFLGMYRVIKQQAIHPNKLVLALDVGSLGQDNQPTDDLLSNLTLTSALEGTTPNAAQKIWHWLELYRKQSPALPHQGHRLIRLDKASSANAGPQVPTRRSPRLPALGRAGSEVAHTLIDNNWRIARTDGWRASGSRIRSRRN